MTADQLRAALAEAGRRRQHAEDQRAEAMRDLQRLARLSDGHIPVAEVARLAGVTRQTIYDLCR